MLIACNVNVESHPYTLIAVVAVTRPVQARLQLAERAYNAAHALVGIDMGDVAITDYLAQLYNIKIGSEVAGILDRVYDSWVPITAEQLKAAILTDEDDDAAEEGLYYQMLRCIDNSPTEFRWRGELHSSEQSYSTPRLNLKEFNTWLGA